MPASTEHQPEQIELTYATAIDNEGREIVSELPPVDGGRKAWGYLVGAFLVEALCYGLPFSFGVMQNYLTTHKFFHGGAPISIVGTVGSGLSYLCAPLSMGITNRFPKYRMTLMYVGFSLSVTLCVFAGFCTTVWELIIVQGVVYGLGTSCLFGPIMSYLNEWFVQRRALAYGIMFAGTGMSGLILPILFEKLLTAYGYALTMRIWAAIMVVFTGPGILFLVKGRLPVNQVSISRRLDLKFLRSPLFLFMAFSNLFQALGFFIPGLYLPSYASDLSMSPIQSSLVLSVLNLASVVGQLLVGFLADKWGSMPPLFLSTLVGACSVVLLWGFSKSFAPLMNFSVIYGLSAGGYSVLYSRVSMEAALDDPNAQLTIYGILLFERGIGNIVAGPVSAALLGSAKCFESYAISKYGGLVIFTGATMVASSVGAFGHASRFLRRHTTS